MARRNGRQEDAADDEDAWYQEQCGICTFRVPLAGDWGLSWGLCTNYASPLDGRAAFEHDGCDVFERAEEWASPDESGLTW
jgi:hypothetical protein